MRTPVLRRVVLVALTLVVALAAVTPVAPVDARSRARKIEPRFTTPYRPGRTFTANTDILSTSGYAAWMIDEALGATTPLPRLGSTFLKVERTEGINARYLVAHAMLESGWGTSDIARFKHNLFGYSAFDRDPWRYATRYRTYKAGVLDVAQKIRDRYLTPTGRWWYGFTTLRGVNRYYASDVHWADKIAVIANELDKLVVTLRERRLRFGRAHFSDDPIARTAVSLEVPWTARRGAVLPKAIRFRVRWTPIALVEAAARGPRRAPTVRWTSVSRTDRPGHVARLALRAPSQPGVWRVDIEARDSDGRALPATDQPRIRSLTVRVAAAREAAVGLSVARDGGLVATIRNLGRRSIAAGRADTQTMLEAWAFPLDPNRAAYRLLAQPVRTSIAADHSRSVRLPAPSTPSVVVLRLTGDPGAVGRTRPAAVLVGRGRAGRLVLTALRVASARDDRLFHRPAARGRISLAATGQPGTVNASVTGGAPAPNVEPAVEAVEGLPGRPWLLVRSISADPSRPAAPSSAILELPREPPTPARIDVTGLPAGMRLVLAVIVAADVTPGDPKTLSLAWIPVTTMDDPDAVPH